MGARKENDGTFEVAGDVVCGDLAVAISKDDVAVAEKEAAKKLKGKGRDRQAIPCTFDPSEIDSREVCTILEKFFSQRWKRWSTS